MRHSTPSLRVADEQGFTLPELLVAMTVGMIILLAGYAVLDQTIEATGQVTARTDASQRGRVAMQSITRTLRSRVCPDPLTPALVQASPNSLEFYADLRGEGLQPDRHLIAYDASSSTITDTVWESTGTAPTFIFPSTPTRSRVVATRVAPDGDALFRYFAYNTTGTPVRPEQPLTGNPLSATDRKRVVVVAVSMVVRPDPAAGDDNVARSSTYRNDVFARLADPQAPQEGSPC